METEIPFFIIFILFIYLFVIAMDFFISLQTHLE